MGHPLPALHPSQTPTSTAADVSLCCRCRAAAHDVAARVEYKNISLQQAMKEVVWGSFAPGDGGFIGVDCNYNCIMDFNSVGMYRGCVDHKGRFETAVFPEGFEEAEAEKA